MDTADPKPDTHQQAAVSGAQLLRFHFKQLSQTSPTITPMAWPHTFPLGTSFSAGCLAPKVLIRDFLYVCIYF